MSWWAQQNQFPDMMYLTVSASFILHSVFNITTEYKYPPILQYLSMYKRIGQLTWATVQHSTIVNNFYSAIFCDQSLTDLKNLKQRIDEQVLLIPKHIRQKEITQRLRYPRWTNIPLSVFPLNFTHFTPRTVSSLTSPLDVQSFHMIRRFFV